MQDPRTPTPLGPDPKRRPVSLFLDLAFPAALLAAFTAACWIWPLDLNLQSSFFDPATSAWPFKDDQPWHLLYHYGNIPALALALGSLALFALSFRPGKLRRWRKVGLFFVLTVILGLAFLVNLTLKEHWGRPRPRDIQQFGGNYSYERPLEFDASSPGKSFPCGHCSTAFVFMSGFLLLRAARRTKLAWFTLLAATAFGSLMGLARMNQGGHFLSDVVWSAGICYLAAVLIFYLLRLDQGVLVDPPPRNKKPKIPAWAIALATLLGLAAVFGILLNTPYHESPAYTDDPSLLDDATSTKFSLLLEPGDHVVSQRGETLTITSTRDGFGLPGSGIKESVNQSRDGGEFYFQFKQRTSGLLIELTHRTEVNLPGSNEKSFVRLAQHGGTLQLTPSPDPGSRRWKLELGGLNKLVLGLPPNTPTKLTWPGSSLPDPLRGRFVKSSKPREWRTGKEKPALTLEFEFDPDRAPAIEFLPGGGAPPTLPNPPPPEPPSPAPPPSP